MVIRATVTRALQGTGARARRFLGDRSGVSAVEFALILPLMLTLYIGGMQISDALTISRKVTHVTSTLGDLVTQSRSISNSDMSNILDITAAVMAPYSSSPLKITVSGVTIDSQGKTKVVWSDALNASALTIGSAITIPDTIKENSSFLVTAEVHYPYTPTIGYVLTGHFDLQDKFYLRPRLSDCISRKPSYTC
jgi:Flp pilus assembly protein TadG